MSSFHDMFIRTPAQQERYQLLDDVVERCADRAREVDEQNIFSFENIEDLRNIHYPALTVPAEYGGAGVDLYELILLQERLAQGDGATALSIGWHLGCMYDLAQKRCWNEDIFAKLCREIVERGALINRAATEPATGSPTRGGKPQTRAEKQGDGWVISGRKTFTSMAPALDYIIVTAVVSDTDDVAEFLVPRQTHGVVIEPTWNMMGMRGTASHDLVLEQVVLGEEALVRSRSQESRAGGSPYQLFIPAVYLGIALAARKEALKFASVYQPNSLDHPIIHVPHIKQLIGKIDLELTAARHFMYAVAERWNAGDVGTHPAELAAVKTVATNTAISVVDQAMRIVGAHSLSLTHPLQRMYRDVRFGLHNPPMDDSTIRLLADRAVNEFANRNEQGE